MLGKPKFKLNQRVQFMIDDKIIKGKIRIIDAFGTFEQNEEVSYDILSDDNIFYKHIPESYIKEGKIVR